MKKILLILSLILLTGCKINSPKEPVYNYLSMYNNLNEKVVIELDNLIKKENLSEEQEKLYKEIMIKQYQNLEYSIVLETYNGNEAIITVKITVNDLYKPQKNSLEFFNQNKEKFSDYNDYLNYKLTEMKNSNERISYTIDFNCLKENNTWILQHINQENLEKIHGIYNYEQD